MMIANYDPLNNVTIVEPMSIIESIMNKKTAQYAFELVIEKKGVFVMSSATFKEHEQDHRKTGGTFRDYLSRAKLMVTQTATGSYSISDPYFDKAAADLKKLEQRNSEERCVTKYMIDYKGRQMSLMSIIREKGLSNGAYMTIRARIQRGWDPVRAIDEPIKEWTV